MIGGYSPRLHETAPPILDLLYLLLSSKLNNPTVIAYCKRSLDVVTGQLSGSSLCAVLGAAQIGCLYNTHALTTGNDNKRACRAVCPFREGRSEGRLASDDRRGAEELPTSEVCAAGSSVEAGDGR